jgi:hypothetical protein
MQEALPQQRLAILQPMQPRDYLEREIDGLSRQVNSSTAVKHLRGRGGHARQQLQPICDPNAIVDAGLGKAAYAPTIR